MKTSGGHKELLHRRSVEKNNDKDDQDCKKAPRRITTLKDVIPRFFLGKL